MTRQLQVLSAGTLISIEQPLTVVVNILSEDLKAQPVHHVPLTREKALALARQLLQSIEAVDRLTAEAVARRTERELNP